MMPRPDHASRDHRFDPAEAASIVPVRQPLNGATTYDLGVATPSDLLAASAQAPAHTTKCPVALAAATAPTPERQTERARWSRRPHVAPGSAATQTVTRIAPPRAPSLPLLGDTLAVVFGDPIRYAQDHLKRHGPVWRSSYQGKPAVFFVGEDIHQLFAQNPVQPDGSRLFACAPAYAILLPFLGQTLLNMDGGPHAAHRRAVAPLFSPRYRAAFLQRLNRIIVEELVARLHDDTGTLNVLPIARRIAFRAGAWLILGLDVDDPRFAHFEALWQDLPPGIFSLTPGFLPASPQTKAKRARRRLNTFLATLMQTVQTAGSVMSSGVSLDRGLGAEVGCAQSRREAPGGYLTYTATHEAPTTESIVSELIGEETNGEEADETSRPTVLSLLMALSPEERATLGLADPLAFHRQSCDHALSILFASIFTTAGIIAWAIAEMARRPDLQARLVGAVEAVELQEDQHAAPTVCHPTATASARTAEALSGGETKATRERRMARTDDGSVLPTVTPSAAAWEQRTPADTEPTRSAALVTNRTANTDPAVRPVTLAETSHRFIQALLTANHQRHHIAPAVARLVQQDFDYPYVPLTHAAIPTAFKTHAVAGHRSRRSSEHTATPLQRLYRIPQGVLAVALSGATQRLPDYVGDPVEDAAPFDPDRFLLHPADRAHPHTLFTFGGGEHRCLGSAFADLEIAATLIQLARTCSFALPAGAPFPKAVYLPSNQPRALTITYQRRDAPAAPSVSLRATSATPPTPASATSAASSAEAFVQTREDPTPPAAVGHHQPNRLPTITGSPASHIDPIDPTDPPASDTLCARAEPAEPPEPPELPALEAHA